MGRGGGPGPVGQGSTGKTLSACGEYNISGIVTPMSAPEDITTTLLGLTRGDGSAADRLMPLVYEKLRGLAEQFMQRERRDHTLQATALLNEAYLRLFDQSRVDWRGRAHFVAMAAEMMRRILVDHARRRAATKRGGGRDRVPLDETLAVTDARRQVDLIALDDALRELQKLNLRQARVVELRYFGGLSVKETAYALDISERTVENDWSVARAWLKQTMGPDQK